MINENYNLPLYCKSCDLIFENLDSSPNLCCAEWKEKRIVDLRLTNFAPDIYLTLSKKRHNLTSSLRFVISVDFVQYTIRFL